jgi:hypothetical protein
MAGIRRESTRHSSGSEDCKRRGTPASIAVVRAVPAFPLALGISMGMLPADG